MRGERPECWAEVPRGQVVLEVMGDGGKLKKETYNLEVREGVDRADPWVSSFKRGGGGSI